MSYEPVTWSTRIAVGVIVCVFCPLLLWGLYAHATWPPPWPN